MAIIATDTGKGDFEQVEPGLHQAVCSHVTDLGLQQSPLYDEKRQVALSFELAEKMRDGRPFMLSRIYTLSLNEKATLRKHLESWRGKVFTGEELRGFDLEKLIGVNVMVNVVHKTRQTDGAVFARIDGLLKCPAGTAPLRPTGQPVPEWIKKLADAGMAALSAKQQEASPPATGELVAEDDLPF